MQLQRQLQKSLVIQFIIPFLFIQLPFCSCCLAPLFQIETGVLADFLPFLFSWSPVLNAIAVMYFVKDFRLKSGTLPFVSRGFNANSTASAVDRRHSGVFVVADDDRANVTVVF